MNRTPENPFSVFTPEGLPADRIVQIFSPAMPGLDNIQLPGHSMVIGTRGSGKSILLRYLEPDCQMLANSIALPAIPFFSLYVSFKETEVQITELQRFEQIHGEVFFNEHLLVLAIACRVSKRLVKNGVVDKVDFDTTRRLLSRHRTALRPLFFSTEDQVLLSSQISHAVSLSDLLDFVNDRIESLYTDAIRYVKRHSFRTEIVPYEGPLYGFDDFLLPYLHFLLALLGLPEAKPLFLLLDDADGLTMTQTKVINSWISRRMSTACSLKIAAQITLYKTRITSSGTRIESVHDYHEINISDLNTRTGENLYKQRVYTMVNRRLQAAGIDTKPHEYFPEDNRQRLAIERETKALLQNWDSVGRGHRPRDDVQRYARPEYIRKLGGTRKSRNSYSYSGFDQLIHVSSGVPRFFLEAAADMFDRASMTPTASLDLIRSIPADIQNAVLRDHAQRQFIWDLRDLRKDVEKLYSTPHRAIRLNNLLTGLGSIFEAALIDERASERKYFSFAFSEHPDADIEEVRELGVRYGYLFRSTIGRKEGIGRTSLYILSRRLAPLFNLDPMGFSAYKFVTNGAVRLLMDQPDEARRMLRRRRTETSPLSDQPELIFGSRDFISD